MADKLVLITGGSRGIGAATAVAAARAGWNVVITWVSDESAANQVVATIAAGERQAMAIKADVADEQQILDAFAVLDRRFGRLDALVNNAGIVSSPQPFADYSAERMRRMLTVNVLGPMLAAREAVRRMSTTSGGSGGSIVNVSSTAARLGSPGEYVDYAASKGAIDTFTLGLSKEIAEQGIRVNAVRPGLIETDIHASSGRPDRISQFAHTVPMRRGGTAAEVADAIVWLMSPQASYVTGALLDIGGGR